MHEDTVVSFSHPDRIAVEDPLTQVLRSGARRLLADAVAAEVEAFIAELADGSRRRDRSPDGALRAWKHIFTMFGSNSRRSGASPLPFEFPQMTGGIDRLSLL